MRISALLLLVFSFSANAASSEAVYGGNGMVVSRSTLASSAGIEFMGMGGNAVDSAVAGAIDIELATERYIEIFIAKAKGVRAA